MDPLSLRFVFDRKKTANNTDNMRVAIKAFVGAEKRPTEALLRLSNYFFISHKKAIFG